MILDDFCPMSSKVTTGGHYKQQTSLDIELKSSLRPNIPQKKAMCKMSVEFAMFYVLCFTCYILRVDAMFVEMATFIFEACVQEDIQVIYIRRGFRIYTPVG